MKSSRPLFYTLKDVYTDISIPHLSVSLPTHCHHPSSVGVFCVNNKTGQVYIIPSYVDLFIPRRNFKLTIEIRDRVNSISRRVALTLQVLDASEQASVAKDDLNIAHPTLSHIANTRPTNRSEVFLNKTSVILLILAISIPVAFCLGLCVCYICKLLATRSYYMRRGRNLLGVRQYYDHRRQDKNNFDSDKRWPHKNKTHFDPGQWWSMETKRSYSEYSQRTEKPGKSTLVKFLTLVDFK